MTTQNKHGLSRHIPANVKRKVRQNSRFGCVLCRRGFYQYEHIDPPFEDCTEHRADAICCLCGSCHDMVTRGQLSKSALKEAYHKIQSQNPEEVEPPMGPLDFHDGSAALLFGGLHYSPVVQTVLRYHGVDLIKVTPGQRGEPGKITACFTNNQGQVTLRLVENEWIGSLKNWDIEIVGKRITVRRKQGEIALKLRLEPPGCLVIEKLDMRFRQGHILVTENTYAVGRYITEQFLRWTYVPITILNSSASGAAIEFTDTETLEVRDLFFQGTGSELATSDRSMVINANAGVLIKPLGIAIASLTGSFQFSKMGVTGDLRLDEMRKGVFNQSENLLQFIARYVSQPEESLADDEEETLNLTNDNISIQNLDKISLISFLHQNRTALGIDIRIAEFTKNNFHLDNENLERYLCDLEYWNIRTIDQLEQSLESHADLIVELYYKLDKQWIDYLKKNTDKQKGGSSPRGVSIIYLTFLLAAMNKDASFIEKYIKDTDRIITTFEEING